MTGGEATSVRRVLFPLLLLLPAVFVPYSTVVSSWFCSDDCFLVHRAATEGMFVSWGEETGGFLRPLTAATFLLDYGIWGLRPAGYHLTSLFFHWLASCAVFLVSLLLFREWRLPGACAVAFLTACLFAVLPSHSEAVSWISGRGDAVAGALALFSVFTFMILVRRSSVGLAVLTLLLYVAASLAKESALPTPLAWLAVYAGCRAGGGPDPTRGSRTVLLLSVACLAGLLTARLLVLGTLVGGVGTARHTHILSLQTPVNLGRFAARVFLPPFYGGFRLWLTTAAFALLALMPVVFIAAGKRQGITRGRMVHLALAALVSLSLLVPVLALPVSLTSTMSERFLYLPGAFAVILPGALTALAFPGKRGVVLLSALVVLSAASLLQVNAVWRKAGEMSRGIADGVAAAPAGTAVILNIPDSYRGAWVMRNGLSRAVSLSGGLSPLREYRVLCFHGVDSMEDAPSVSREDGRITLLLPAGWDVVSADEGCTVSRVGRDSLTARDPGNVTVLWWDGRGIRELR